MIELFSLNLLNNFAILYIMYLKSKKIELSNQSFKVFFAFSGDKVQKVNRLNCSN